MFTLQPANFIIYNPAAESTEIPWLFMGLISHLFKSRSTLRYLKRQEQAWKRGFKPFHCVPLGPTQTSNSKLGNEFQNPLLYAQNGIRNHIPNQSSCMTVALEDVCTPGERLALSVSVQMHLAFPVQTPTSHYVLVLTH